MYGAVAQLGERHTCTVEVAGSIPVSSTKFKFQIFDNLEINAGNGDLISVTNNVIEI